MPERPLLVNFAPILVAVFAGFFMGEGFPKPLLIGILIAFAGVLLIALGGSGGSHNDELGIILGLITAVLYAAGVLMQKVALRTVDAVMATWVGCLAGVLATVPFAPQAIDELADASAGAITGVIFLGVGPTAIAFLTWAYALTRTDAGKMAATTLAVPAIAIGLSWLFLGEVPTPLGLVGGAMALTGVAISRRRSRPTADVLRTGCHFLASLDGSRADGRRCHRCRRTVRCSRTEPDVGGEVCRSGPGDRLPDARWRDQLVQAIVERG